MRKIIGRFFSPLGSRSSLILVLIGQSFLGVVLSESALSQTGADSQSKFRALVNRLPANAKYAIAPPSLRGSSVALYQDPQNKKAYYVTPMLLPDWETLRAEVKNNCVGQVSPMTIHEISMQLEFGRDKIRSEIAEVATQLEKTTISKDQIFVYPYAWLSVQTGAKAQISSRRQKLPVQTIAELTNPPICADS